MAKKKKIKIVAIGGTYDHIHLFIKTDKIKPVEPLLRYIFRGNTSA